MSCSSCQMTGWLDQGGWGSWDSMTGEDTYIQNFDGKAEGK